MVNISGRFRHLYRMYIYKTAGKHGLNNRQMSIAETLSTDISYCFFFYLIFTTFSFWDAIFKT